MSQYTKNYGSRVMSLLEKSYEKEKEGLKGQAAGATREAMGNLKTQAQRQGIVGSPIGTGLKQETKQRIGGSLRQGLTSLSGQKIREEASLTQDIEKMKLEEKIATDKANMDLLTSILGGAASLVTSALVPGGFLANLAMTPMQEADKMVKSIGGFTR